MKLCICYMRCNVGCLVNTPFLSQCLCYEKLGVIYLQTSIQKAQEMKVKFLCYHPMCLFSTTVKFVTLFEMFLLCIYKTKTACFFYAFTKQRLTSTPEQNKGHSKEKTLLTHFLGWKSLCFDWNSLSFVSKDHVNFNIAIGSGNELVPSWGPHFEDLFSNQWKFSEMENKSPLSSPRKGLNYLQHFSIEE